MRHRLGLHLLVLAVGVLSAVQCQIEFIDAGVSQEDIELALYHHSLCRNVSGPTAAAMPLLKWNKDLARGAQSLANTLEFGHDAGNVRRAKLGWCRQAGQNVAAGFKNLSHAIDGWCKERKQHEYGVGGIDGKVVGHFTMEVNDRVTHVGCGMANYLKSFTNDKGKTKMKGKRIYVCNYSRAQRPFRLKKPYKEGEPCSGCPGRCDWSINACTCEEDVLCKYTDFDPATCQCEGPDEPDEPCEDQRNMDCGLRPTCTKEPNIYWDESTCQCVSDLDTGYRAWVKHS